MASIPSYVINLDRHPERWGWILKCTSDLEISMERIAAVDAYAKEDMDKINAVLGMNKIMTRGEAACLLSHQKSWKAFLESGQDFCAIFEDDVHFSDRLGCFLDPLLIPKAVHLLKIETTLRKTSIRESGELTIGDRSAHRLLAPHYGTGGYIVSRECAEFLNCLAETHPAASDVLLFSHKSPLWEKYQPLQLVPALCIQEQFLSRNQERKAIFDSDLEMSRQIRRESNTSQGRKSPFRFAKKIKKHIRLSLNGAHITNPRKPVNFR